MTGLTCGDGLVLCLLPAREQDTPSCLHGTAQSVGEDLQFSAVAFAPVLLGQALSVWPC